MKQMILLLSMVFAATALTAQVEIKPTIGVNFSNITKDPDNGSASGQTGWQFGGSIEYGNKVYGELGVLYVQESAEFTSNNPDFEDIDFSQKGFRIPLSIGWNIRYTEMEIQNQRDGKLRRWRSVPKETQTGQ